MKSENILVGIILIIMGILGFVIRSILVGFNNLWDFIISSVFIVVIIMGILILKEK